MIASAGSARPARPALPLLAFLALLICSLSVAPTRAQHTVASDDQAGRQFLWSYRWRGAVAGARGQGGLCWLRGADQALRVELGRDGVTPLSLADLVHCRGDGLTLVQTADLGGTRNPWQEGWTSLDPRQGLWLRLVLDVVEQMRPSVPVLEAGVNRLATGQRPGGARPFFGDMSLLPPSGNAHWRFQLPGLPAGGRADRAKNPLRRRLVERGLGRGGEDAILDIVLRETEDEGQVWRLTSTRVPGWAELHRRRTLLIAPPSAEAFIPLWPLAEILDLPADQGRP